MYGLGGTRDRKGRDPAHCPTHFTDVLLTYYQLSYGAQKRQVLLTYYQISF